VLLLQKKWNGAGVDLGYRSLSSQSVLCYFFINLAASRLPSNNSLKAHFPCITLCKHKVEERVFRLILQECCFWENACLPPSVIFKNIMCIWRSKTITCRNSSVSIRLRLLQHRVSAAAARGLASAAANSGEASDPPARAPAGLVPRTSDGWRRGSCIALFFTSEEGPDNSCY